MISIKTQSGDYPLPEHIMLSHWHTCLKWGFEDPKSWPLILHEVTGCPITEINQISDTVIEMIFGVFIQQFDHDVVPHYDFDKLNFGQFVDLDVMLSLGVDKWMMQIWQVLTGEDDQLYRASWPIIIEAHKWRKRVYEEYDEFFGLSEIEKAKERGVEIDETPSTLSSLQTSWYNVIQLICNEDLTKQDWVTDQPYRKVLNWLTWKKWREEQLEMELLKKR